MQNQNIVISIYDNPDKYPPTLNAIQLLSKQYKKVIIVWRGDKNTIFNLPKNCINYRINSADLLRSSYFLKIVSLVKFTFKTYQITSKYNPKWLICYDLYSFFAAIILFFLKKKKIWYHNHDVTDLKFIKKHSLTYFCWKVEQRFINNVSLFSLPDLSRTKFFNYKKKVVLLPNYPTLEFNVDIELTKPPSTIKVLYQGRVTDGHGLLDFIKYLKSTTYPISLHIIGSYDLMFKEKLETFIKDTKLNEKVFLYQSLPYEKLKQFSSKFHVGIGILEPINIAYSTAAQASNKIYEYSALGLPVILFDSLHYRSVLQNYCWAKFTDFSKESFDSIFEELFSNYTNIRAQAFRDYRNMLNFEKHFSDIYQTLAN